MAQQADIPFLTKNLRSGEEIIFTARPPRSKQIALSFFKNTVIPFPFAWLWGVIDLGVLIGVPIGTAGTDATVIAFVVPFILVHATPFWIYCYNVIANIRDAKSRGYILTTERILFRMERKKPYTAIELKQIETVQVTNTSSVSWYKIFITLRPDFNSKEKDYSLEGLSKPDVERMYERIEAILEDYRRLENKVKFRATCLSCGGKTEDGRCLYCGTRAELRKPEDQKSGTRAELRKQENQKKGTRASETKEQTTAEQELQKKIEAKYIRELQQKNKQTVSELMALQKNKK